MQIHGLNQAHTVQSINQADSAAAAKQNQATEAVRPSTVDQLDLSPEAQALSRAQEAQVANDTSGIRMEKVAAIRQAIADGSYETPERLSAALDKMLDSFA